MLNYNNWKNKIESKNCNMYFSLSLVNTCLLDTKNYNNWYIDCKYIKICFSFFRNNFIGWYIQ